MISNAHSWMCLPPDGDSRMSIKLPYLVRELNAALEIYISARTGQQYNRTAFILCDDVVELANKLFLLTNNSAWSDTKANGHFKRFNDVIREVRSAFETQRAGELPVLNDLLKRIKRRRQRRNQFFHSTHLLDLNLHAKDCVEAFVDIIDYGALLFQSDWSKEVGVVANMESCEALMRLDQKSYSDPTVPDSVNAIVSKWPRTGRKPPQQGCEVTRYAEDLHLRLVIRNGEKTLRDRLQGLL